MFDIMIRISQGLTQDIVKVTRHEIRDVKYLVLLVFPSQRLVKHGINLSGVGEKGNINFLSVLRLEIKVQIPQGSKANESH